MILSAMMQETWCCSPVADLFRNFFRATDICCRYGGEEFATILPESRSQDAAIRADIVRTENAFGCSARNETLGQLTLSAGVAAFPKHGSTSVELLKAADKSLYESKLHGCDVVDHRFFTERGTVLVRAPDPPTFDPLTEKQESRIPISEAVGPRFDLLIGGSGWVMTGSRKQ